MVKKFIQKNTYRLLRCFSASSPFFFFFLFFFFFCVFYLLGAWCLVFGWWENMGKQRKYIYIYIYIFLFWYVFWLYTWFWVFFCLLGVNYFGPIFPLAIVYTEPTTFWHESNHSDLTPSPIGDKFELPPLDSIRLVMGWAQTRPKLTRGHPFKPINTVNKPISNEPINL